jgi:hypothetical protein
LSLSADEAKAIIRLAFKPLNCIAENKDESSPIRFTVKDVDGNPIYRGRIPPFGFSRPDVLTTLLSKDRERVMRKGFALNPWKLPEMPEDSSVG